MLTLAGGAYAQGSLTITQRHSGKTFEIHRGADAVLRLSGRWHWTTPRVSKPAAVQLVRVDYFADPGYSEWELRVIRARTVTITSTGSRACTRCTLAPRRFRVTIRGT